MNTDDLQDLQQFLIQKGKGRFNALLNDFISDYSAHKEKVIELKETIRQQNKRIAYLAHRDLELIKIEERENELGNNL